MSGQKKVGRKKAQKKQFIMCLNPKSHQIISIHSVHFRSVGMINEYPGFKFNITMVHQLSWGIFEQSDEEMGVWYRKFFVNDGGYEWLFGLVFIKIIIIIKSVFFFLTKTGSNQPILVWFGYFRTKTGSNRFVPVWLGFSGLACFFCLARFG